MNIHRAWLHFGTVKPPHLFNALFNQRLIEPAYWQLHAKYTKLIHTSTSLLHIDKVLNQLLHRTVTDLDRQFM